MSAQRLKIREKSVRIYEGTRIAMESRCRSKFYYELRHGDDQMVPVSISPNHIGINYWGTIEVDEPLGVTGEVSLSKRDRHYLMGREG